MTKRWVLDVKEAEDGDKFIELNDEILAESGFRIGDKLKWVDNMDGSFTIMNADKMAGYSLTSEFSNPKTNRSVLIYKSETDIDRVIDMYENNSLIHSRKITGYTSEYTEDCAENWVMCYGEFSK